MHTFEKPKTAQQSASVKPAAPVRGHLGQSPEVRSILHLQRTIGNRAVQAKLAINQPGDSYEQEADRVAEQVMRRPEPRLQRACSCDGECPDCHAKQTDREHESLQTRRVQGSDPGHGTAPPSVDAVLRSSGQPLDPATRSFMEPRFGHDFSQVRVHTGTAAEESARDVNAHAYTVGHDVVFGAGRFAPESHAGRQLLAHELTHVVQQSGPTEARIQRAPADPQPPKADVPVLGGSKSTSEFVVLYHYGDLESSREWGERTGKDAALKSTRSYPRLTDCGTATCQAEVSRHTGTPQNDHLRYKYEVRIAKDYFEKNFTNTGTRGAYSEFATKQPVPLQFFRLVSEVGPASSAPPRLPSQSGVITTPPPKPPSTPPGGAAPAGSAQSTSVTSAPAGTTKVKAEVGAPLKPVVEATPGFNPGKGAALGAGAQVLQAKMFGNIQRAEVAKYEKRLAELQPKIDAFLANGYSVELTLIVEKPNRPDVLCAAGVFCDASQFIYFRDLHISFVETVKPVVNIHKYSRHASIWPRGGRDGMVPYTHQGGSLYDEKIIPHLSARDSNHHCDYKKLTLYPQEYQSPFPPVRPLAPQPVKPKPPLDLETRKAMALAPSRVYILSGNIVRYKTAYEVMKKLAGNPLFGEVKDYMAGLNMNRTVISYRSDLDKPRAEALAEIVRAEGLPSAYAELSGDGTDAPGALQIFFGRDADKAAAP
jgi:hypothetical protein